MRVETLMTAEPTACSSEESLASAATKMWNDDCGILPVVDDGRLVGVVTDRDIAMALAMKGAPAGHVRVGEVTSGRIFSCAATDDVESALAVMRDHRVRRLPVVDGERLLGIVSLNDVVLEASPRAGAQGRPTYGDIVKTLKAICAHGKLPATT